MADDDQNSFLSDQSDSGGVDSFVEETSTGWLSRIGRSLVGVLVGLVGIVVAIGVLYWNEGRAVEAATALQEGAGTVISTPARPLDAAKEGRLVHVVGSAEAVMPARDPVLGVGAPGLLRLRRAVETFQWKEETRTQTTTELGGSERTRTIYEYSKVWSETPISSDGFRIVAGHVNPKPSLRTLDVTAPDARLGDFRLAPALITQLDDFQPLPAETVDLSSRGFRPVDSGFYRGNDPANPRIGDMRLHFEAVSGQPVTVVAGQISGELVPFNTSNGYEIALISPGTKPAAALFKAAQQDEALLTWILRAAGFIGMLICLSMLFQPLAVLVSVLPFLEPVVGAGVFMVSLVLAIPLTLLTIAVAWFAHRPLYGAILIIAGVIGPLAISRLVKRKAA
ncbi:MAG: TMEM43 family protein [Rhodospirillaceae bacterium]